MDDLIEVYGKYDKEIKQFARASAEILGVEISIRGAADRIPKKQREGMSADDPRLKIAETEETFDVKISTTVLISPNSKEICNRLMSSFNMWKIEAAKMIRNAGKDFITAKTGVS